MTTIGIISDTHIRSDGKRRLPPQVLAAFQAVDLILHAGDLNTLEVVAELEALAPVVAVRGNNDEREVLQRLPVTQRIPVEDCVIGLVHGDPGNTEIIAGPIKPLEFSGNRETAAYAVRHFQYEDDIQCVVFGHSHRSLVAWHEVEGRRVLLFNPGSPTDKRWGPHHSCGLLRVDGQRLDPELITW